MFIFGGPNSGRKPNPKPGPKPSKPTKPTRFCLYCGKPLPEDTHGGRDYCNDACQQKQYRQRQAERNQAQ
jgi:predicted nucleic acid-binding Zn ribbon protein